MQLEWVTDAAFRFFSTQPDVNALDKYQRNPGAPSGFWPTSPEISRAMLERYGMPEPTSK
jgi:hypothetical protein